MTSNIEPLQNSVIAQFFCLLLFKCFIDWWPYVRKHLTYQLAYCILFTFILNLNIRADLVPFCFLFFLHTDLFQISGLELSYLVEFWLEDFHPSGTFFLTVHTHTHEQSNIVRISKLWTLECCIWLRFLFLRILSHFS